MSLSPDDTKIPQAGRGKQLVDTIRMKVFSILFPTTTTRLAIQLVQRVPIMNETRRVLFHFISFHFKCLTSFGRRRHKVIPCGAGANANESCKQSRKGKTGHEKVIQDI